MADSEAYKAIRGVLVGQPTMAISAQWKGGAARILWPLVIGTTGTGDEEEIERLLSFEFVAADPTAKKFRCFKIKDLTVTANPAVAWPANPTPNGLRFKQVKKQNCVEDVDVFRQRV